MERRIFRIAPGLALLAGALVWLMPGASGQSQGMPGTRNSEWTHYTADVRGSRFMPLDQINGSNFGSRQ